jgi:WD40 repeat protein
MKDFLECEKEDLIINSIKDILNFAELLKKVPLSKSQFAQFSTSIVHNSQNHHTHCLEKMLKTCYPEDDQYFYSIIKPFVKAPHYQQTLESKIQRELKRITSDSECSSGNSGDGQGEFTLGKPSLDEDTIVIPLHTSKDSYANCISFSPDSKTICAGFQNGMLMCWDITGWRKPSKFSLRKQIKLPDPILRLNFVRNNVVICALKSKEVLYINIETKAFIKKIKFDSNYD